MTSHIIIKLHDSVYFRVRMICKSLVASCPWTVLLLLVLALLPYVATAATKANGDLAYQRGNYQVAIADYRSLLKKGVSADLYYNLGNAYYRTDSLAQAILCYERAYELAPGDDDIRFNLQFARSKTIDKITHESEMFFVTWYRGLVNFTGVDQWAKTALVAIFLALILVLVYLFSSSLLRRKVAFFSAIVLLVVFLAANLFAYQQKQTFEHSAGAIVMASSVNVKKTPVANSSDAFVLHEGTRVEITDRSIKGWVGIHLADGRDGWMNPRALEEI